MKYVIFEKRQMEKPRNTYIVSFPAIQLLFKGGAIDSKVATVNGELF